MLHQEMRRDEHCHPTVEDGCDARRADADASDRLGLMRQTTIASGGVSPWESRKETRNTLQNAIGKTFVAVWRGIRVASKGISEQFYCGSVSGLLHRIVLQFLYLWGVDERVADLREAESQGVNDFH